MSTASSTARAHAQSTRTSASPPPYVSRSSSQHGASGGGSRMSLALTYPRPSRTRSALQQSSLSNGGRFSSSRGAAHITTHDDLLPSIEQDLLLSDGYLEYEEEEGVEALSKRTEELLRGGLRSKAVSSVLDDCVKCTRYLDHATKLQVQVNELRSALDSARDESERKMQVWAEERTKLERKREASTRVLREELDRASELLREEAEACGRRVREMKVLFESETASEVGKYRAEIEELRRTYERQLAESRAKQAESEASQLIELNRARAELDRTHADLDRARSELVSAQETARAAQASADELRSAQTTLIAEEKRGWESARRQERLEDNARLEAELVSLRQARIESERALQEQAARAQEDQKRLHQTALDTQKAEYESILQSYKANHERMLSEALSTARSELEAHVHVLEEDKLRLSAQLSEVHASQTKTVGSSRTDEVDKWRGEAERWRKAAEAVELAKKSQQSRSMTMTKGTLIRRVAMLLATLLASFASLIVFILVKSPYHTTNNNAYVQEGVALVRETVLGMLGATALAAPPS